LQWLQLNQRFPWGQINAPFQLRAIIGDQNSYNPAKTQEMLLAELFTFAILAVNNPGNKWPRWPVQVHPVLMPNFLSIRSAEP
jgi:hypothetical protein